MTTVIESESAALDDLLAQLHLARVSLTANAETGQLIARPRANLTPALSAAITAHKSDLLALVAEPMEYEERLLWGLGRRAQRDPAAVTGFLAALSGYEASGAHARSGAGRG